MGNDCFVTVPIDRYEALVECAASIEALARLYSSQRYVGDDEVKAILGIRIDDFREDDKEEKSNE